ncbi:cupin domain-containing protein [Halomonas alimentaria]|uniref:Cupin domain-containing protein n=1 Tax=Halomonas alimentaria TaxID=147248 RepID=A0A7X4W3A3_9GAMM|nr:cupin domain-containing protein [Halomonas alimentaria]NAW33435.1 cupin domain-containing protein [Halomonas alimentaria]
MRHNIFALPPGIMAAEQFDELEAGKDVRIERIVSRGHTSPEEGWYDQPQHEWVTVLQGRAVLAFASGEEVELAPGDHLTIPAHRRHRVKWTDPQQATVWLAVHYSA